MGALTHKRQSGPMLLWDQAGLILEMVASYKHVFANPIADSAYKRACIRLSG